MPCEPRQHPGTIQPDFCAWKDPGGSESKLQPNLTFLAHPTPMPNVTNIAVAHTILDQTAWMAPLSILWNKEHLLGQKNPEFYAFLDVWEPIKVAGTTPNEAFSPNQRTLGTPKPLQMHHNVVPPYAL